MTSREWLADILSQGPRSELLPLELRMIFRQLHDNLPYLKLRNGASVRDVPDVLELCREMIDHLSPVYPIPPPTKSVCPRCGHVHKQGEKECGEDMGGGGVCKCDLEVSA